ncbi:PREDICTED: beta-1,3-galactosyltransferase 1-like [Priapulus caudatus]|uniref:Hexosyltransferase n=1 Tax=Priapulus caudatus TaxID=37621 RepID=A0ABM1F1H1_PRICU|nr:PREDICTED: beta-1,3-galactosyltransferase 1-like [Priapulus caudatus]
MTAPSLRQQRPSTTTPRSADAAQRYDHGDGARRRPHRRRRPTTQAGSTAAAARRTAQSLQPDARAAATNDAACSRRHAAATNDASVQPTHPAPPSETFGDVIRADFREAYRNLTMKSVTALHVAASRCRAARFVMKIDTDTFLNAPKLLRYCRGADAVRNMFGYAQVRKPPIRNAAHKWYVSQREFDGDVFPDYLSGTGYVMSGDVPPLLYVASLTTPLLAMEDVYVNGMLAETVGVPRRHHAGFVIDNRFQFRTPKKYVTIHPCTQQQLREAWKRCTGE